MMADIEQEATRTFESSGAAPSGSALGMTVMSGGQVRLEGVTYDLGTGPAGRHVDCQPLVPLVGGDLSCLLPARPKWPEGAGGFSRLGNRASGRSPVISGECHTLRVV